MFLHPISGFDYLLRVSRGRQDLRDQRVRVQSDARDQLLQLLRSLPRSLRRLSGGLRFSGGLVGLISEAVADAGEYHRPRQKQSYDLLKYFHVNLVLGLQSHLGSTLTRRYLPSSEVQSGCQWSSGPEAESSATSRPRMRSCDGYSTQLSRGRRRPLYYLVDEYTFVGQVDKPAADWQSA